MKYYSFILLPLLFVTLSGLAPARKNIAEQDMVQAILNYTNQYRKSKGRSPLVLKDELCSLAAGHSQNMARARVGFGHSGFDKRSRQARRIVPGMHAFAENVAYGSETAKEVVTGWARSRGHRENMLGNYMYIGIGTARNSRGVIYYTEVFAN